MSSSRRGSTRHSDDAMDDDSDDKDTKRKSRNLSEKKRRDQFNLLVNELSSMVATGSRKMDKSTVLKSTISFLKNHNEIAVRSRVHEIQEDWKPTFLTNEEFTHLMLEGVDGFIVVFAMSGQIYYASESVTSLLGHLTNDLLSMTIYDLIYEDEQADLYNALLGSIDDGGSQHVSFSCHMRRGGIESSQQAHVYDLIQFVGYFRSNSDLIIQGNDNKNNNNNNNRYCGFSGDADTRLVFVGTGRVQTPQLIRDMPLIDSSKSEFTSRHSLEWKFLFLDHRAPPIIGYLPFELLGTSGYDYYHTDDLERVVNCHEALMSKGEGTSCFYRFLTKGQQWIWLQTRFYITYHQWNSKPEFIVCTHRVVSYVDVLRQSEKLDEVFDVFSDNSPSNDTSSSSQWPNRNNSNKSHVAHGPPSDCNSVDSPTSRHSVKSRTSQGKQQQQTNNVVTQSCSNNSNNNSQTSLFMEPQQYVAAIPVQPMIASFQSPSAAVLSPIPAVVGNVVVPCQAQTQLQADLQRKHAELQAMIGQQQAELRRVSEQLLMVRLGILPASQSQQNLPTTTYQANPVAGGTVSSTTTISGMPVSPNVVPVPNSVTLPQQSTMINSLSDSSDELKK